MWKSKQQKEKEKKPVEESGRSDTKRGGRRVYVLYWRKSVELGSLRWIWTATE